MGVEKKRCKRLLIEVWFGIQQSVADQAIDQRRTHLNACVKTTGKHFWTQLLMICDETYITVLCFITFNLLWLLKFLALVF